MSTDHTQRVVSYAIQNWHRTFAGTSALDIAAKLSIPHEDVRAILEQLGAQGKGRLNRDVELYQVTLNPMARRAGITRELVKTHIYFPSKDLLHADFYSSELAQRNLPEYQKRLHLGANQVGLVFFSEEVLARYLSHPELYEVNDSLAGGEITSYSSGSEDRQLYVRYGKSRQVLGQTAVTAIYKDLALMSAAEQRYWHSYELDRPKLAPNDENFDRFLARTYEGEFVDYPNPIAHVLAGLAEVNQLLAPDTLFKRLQNTHLRFPVEQTYKALCDCSSELYKVIGPDGMDQSTLRKLLRVSLGIEESRLIHTESKRPLSTLQLLSLAEQMLQAGGSLTTAIRNVGEYRVDADHKVLPKESELANYSDVFSKLCSDLVAGLSAFKSTLGASRVDT